MKKFACMLFVFVVCAGCAHQTGISAQKKTLVMTYCIDPSLPGPSMLVKETAEWFYAQFSRLKSVVLMPIRVEGKDERMLGISCRLHMRKGRVRSDGLRKDMKARFYVHVHATRLFKKHSFIRVQIFDLNEEFVDFGKHISVLGIDKGVLSLSKQIMFALLWRMRVEGLASTSVEVYPTFSAVAWYRYLRGKLALLQQKPIIARRYFQGALRLDPHFLYAKKSLERMN